MQLEVLRSTDELAALEGEWTRTEIPSPMQSHAWITTWWEVYGSRHRELCVVVARDADQTVGIAPMYIDTRGNLRWLGDGDVCSDHASLLAVEGYHHEFARRLADWLHNSTATSWRNIVFESIDSESSVYRTMLSALTNSNTIRSGRSEVGSCYVELPDTWEEYLLRVSKNHRKRCRRWIKTYFLSGRAIVDTATTPEACLRYWDTLVRLHNDRRNQMGECGVFENQYFARFHERVVPKLAAVGNLQLRILRVDGQALAAEYVLQDDTTWYAYQSGLSPEGEAVSAGNLSIVALMRDAISAGCKRVDLLRGVEPYKFSWNAERLPSKAIIFRRPTLAGHVATLRDSVKALARDFKNLAGTPLP